VSELCGLQRLGCCLLSSRLLAAGIGKLGTTERINGCRQLFFADAYHARSALRTWSYERLVGVGVTQQSLLQIFTDMLFVASSTTTTHLRNAGCKGLHFFYFLYNFVSSHLVIFDEA
jgi:hypothetical protein